MQASSKPKGLAKIWREIKRPFKKVVREGTRPFRQLGGYLYRKLSGITLEQIAESKSYEEHLSEVYIRDDGKVNFPHVDIDIVLVCNLRCCHCNRLSPYRKGFVPTEKIIYWSDTWSKKIRPAEVYIVGGEPFLHPDLTTILIESHKIWSDSVLKIYSNGLLIHQIAPSIFETLKMTKSQVVISDYPGIDLPRERFIAGCVRMEQYGIPYQVTPKEDNWLVQYQQTNKDAVPGPFKSCSRKAWASCYTKRCPSLADNRLYKCTVLASRIAAVNEGAISPTLWKDALTYTPLPPDADAALILKHLRSKEIMECCICPEKQIVTKSRQLPLVQPSRKTS